MLTMNTESIINKREIAKASGHTRVQWAMAILINLAPLTYGMQLGWVSPMTKVLQSVESPAGRPLTDAEISLIAGIPSLAAVVGIVILLYVVDNFGRKWASLIIAIFQLLCWIIMLCSTSYTSLLVARICCGLGAGSCFHVIPMYIKELSQDDIRGTLVSIGVLFQNIGILIIYAVGAYLDYNSLLYVVVGLPLVNIVAILIVPESPSFLISKGKIEKAAQTIAFLRGLNVSDQQVVNEIDVIKKEDDYFKSMTNLTFLNIFKNVAWRRGFIIMVLIFTGRGMNGVFYITNYAANVLADSDVNISPDLQTLAIPIFLTIGGLFVMFFVERLGRKLLLETTFIISALTFTALASTMLCNIYGFSSPGWLPVVMIIVSICCYGAGVSPVPFIIASEMFNFQIRGKLMACLISLAWFMSFVQIISISAISAYLGAYMSFYVFGAINFFGAITTIILLPETGSKSVSQIEKDLRKEE